MAWLMFYGSIAGAMLVVLMARYARSVRGDILRLVAIITAASLWPLMAVGLAQFGAVRLLSAYLQRRAFAPSTRPETPVNEPFAGEWVQLSA